MIHTTPAFARLIFPSAVTTALVLFAPAPTAHAQPPPRWRWPLPGSPEVIRGFDPPDLAWGSGHRGVDLGAQAGEPVYAAGAGRTGYVGRIAGRGIVTIVHGNRRTTYLPVRPSVHAGDRVKAGSRIGTVEPGFAHCPARVCLHWGLIRAKTYLDPLALLPRSPVRLLPLTGHPARAAPVGQLAGATPARHPAQAAPARQPARTTAAPGPPARRSRPARVKPVAELTRSAVAGSSGAGLVLLVLAASRRAPDRRARRTQSERATAMRYHPAGGRRAPSAPAARSGTNAGPGGAAGSGTAPAERSPGGGRSVQRPVTGPYASRGPGTRRSSGDDQADPPEPPPDTPSISGIGPVPTGRHRKRRLLARLVARLRRPFHRRRTAEDPDAPCAEVIDLETERRLRRPTDTDERDPA